MSETFASMARFVRGRLSDVTIEGGDEAKILHAALGLGGEAGEVQNLVKKQLFGKVVENPEMKLADEMADILFYWIMMADTLGIDFDWAMAHLREKLGGGHGWRN